MIWESGDNLKDITAYFAITASNSALILAMDLKSDLTFLFTDSKTVNL